MQFLQMFEPVQAYGICFQCCGKFQFVIHLFLFNVCACVQYNRDPSSVLTMLITLSKDIINIIEGF